MTTHRSGRPAVFLDRDGTIIEDSGYLSSPADVKLLPGAADALHLLEQAGYLRIVITNQSGIARGFFTARDFNAVQDEVESQLRQNNGSTLDGAWHCPHREEDACSCRKPGLLLYTQAANHFGIDLSASWCIGDRLSDLRPARELGARACLVLTGEGRQHQVLAEQEGFHVEEDLLAAVRRRIVES